MLLTEKSTRTQGFLQTVVSAKMLSVLTKISTATLLNYNSKNLRKNILTVIASFLEVTWFVEILD